MAIPNVEDLSIEILNNMENNIEYSRNSIIKEQRRLLLVKKKKKVNFNLQLGLL